MRKYLKWAKKSESEIYRLNSGPVVEVALLWCKADVRSLDEAAGITALADPVLSWNFIINFIV